MRLAKLQTGTKILGSFFIVSLAIVIVAAVALWRLHAADQIASSLVNDKLAKQQLASELLGAAHLNGSRTVAIARSDSLELADYFHAQLAEGKKAVAALEAKMATLPASGEERALLEAATQRRSAVAAIQEELFRLKDMGQTQAVEELVVKGWQDGFAAYTGALDALLEHETQQAHALAAQSARASGLSRLLLVALGGGALAVGSLLAWMLTRSIVGPLQQAVGLAELVARGDLRPHIRHERHDEIGRLFDALNGMTTGVSATVERVLSGAQQIDSASAEIADGNLDLSNRTERQAGALRQTVAAMEELTGAITQNNASAQKANELAQSASDVATEGAQAVQQLVVRMGAIKSSAERIVQITGMIDSIAFQTNILALNAAVEAARAGSEGRGFAVVAAEVRNLAQHSAEAAKEIKKLIGTSVSEIEAGTGIANAAGSTMRAVLEHVHSVADILATIHSASMEQASGVTQVGRAIAEMDLATQQNAAMVEEAAAAAESMRDQAGQLSLLVATFKVRAGSAPAAIPALTHTS